MGHRLATTRHVGAKSTAGVASETKFQVLRVTRSCACSWPAYDGVPRSMIYLHVIFENVSYIIVALMAC